MEYLRPTVPGLMLDHQNLVEVQSAAQLAVRAALGNSAAVASIEHWGGGAHNSGYALLLADGRRLFIKIEKVAIFPRTRRCQIEREVYGLRLAREAGLDVPEVVGYDFSGSTAGCRYLLEEFIAGDLLGEACEKLSEAEQAPLLAAFEEKIVNLCAIRGAYFGELYPGGWLGQYDSWPAMLAALSAILVEDAAALAYYSEDEMKTVQASHAAALEAIHYAGPAILTHNDLHIYNAFTVRENGALRVGKLFDFGLSLFQAGYLACFGQFGYNGKEAEVAGRFGVSEDELRAHALLSDLEFVNFANAIQFAPDQPYGCAARRVAYLEACKAHLAKG